MEFESHVAVLGTQGKRSPWSGVLIKSIVYPGRSRGWGTGSGGGAGPSPPVGGMAPERGAGGAGEKRTAMLER
jgi:hypothetical protein